MKLKPLCPLKLLLSQLLNILIYNFTITIKTDMIIKIKIKK